MKKKKIKRILNIINACLSLVMFNVLLLLVIDIIINKGYVNVFLIEKNPITTVIGFFALITIEIICLENWSPQPRKGKGK